MEKVLREYLDHIFKMFEQLKDHLDYSSIEQAKRLILECEANGGRVHLTGVGKPSYVAGYIAALLSSTGTPAYVLDATEAVHGSSGQVLPGDVVIAISNSGETEELKAAVSTVLSNGAKVIGVTGNPQSWLAKSCDIYLFAGVEREGDSLNKPPRASILMETFVLQLLTILLQEHKHITEDLYVKWHPGGTIGKSIMEKMKSINK